MTTFKLKDKLTFGKYKGQSVDEVIDNDPDYLVWAVEEIDWFELDEETEKELEDGILNGEDTNRYDGEMGTDWQNDVY